MKIYLLLFVLASLQSFVYANESRVIAVNNGEWSSPATWDCHCLPSGNTNLVIPENIMVHVSGIVHLKGARKITVTINGTLDLAGRNIYLDNNDIVIVGEQGAIRSSGHVGELYFGSMPVLVLASVTIGGPAEITAGTFSRDISCFTAERNGPAIRLCWTSGNDPRQPVNYTIEHSENGVLFNPVAERLKTPNEAFQLDDTVATHTRMYYRLTPANDKSKSLVILVDEVAVKQGKINF